MVVTPASATTEQAVLRIPPGALSEPAEITIERIDRARLPLPTGGLLERQEIVPGAAYDFGPDGLTFLVPAELSITYREDALAARPESELELFLVDGTPERIAGAAIDEVNNQITARLDHFSVYVAAIRDGTSVGVEETVAVTDVVTIEVRPALTSSVGEAVAVADVVVVSVIAPTRSSIDEAIGVTDDVTVEVLRPARSEVLEAVAVTDAVSIDVVRSPSGAGVAYVALAETDSVAVIDLESDSVIRTIQVGPTPYAVAANPARREVYVTNRSGFSVSVISTMTHTVVGTIDLVEILDPRDIAVSRDGSRAYVSDVAQDVVQIIELSTRAVVGELLEGPFSPQTVTTDPVRERLYVSGSDVVGVFDLATDLTIDTISLGGGPGSLASEHVATTPDGGELWLAYPIAGEVTIVDLATRAVSGTIEGLSNPSGVAIDDDVAWILTTSPTSITPVSLASRVPGSPIPLESGVSSTWLAVSADGRTAVATEGSIGSRSRVSIVDLVGGTVRATLTVGSAPSGVVIVPNP